MPAKKAVKEQNGAKKISPFAIVGGTVSGVRGFFDGLTQARASTYLLGNTVVQGSATGSLRGALSNGLKSTLRLTGSAAARVLGLAALGGAIVVEVTDQGWGTEAFLRQAIRECNKGSCATGKVEPGASTIFFSVLGFSFADTVQKYIDANE